MANIFSCPSPVSDLEASQVSSWLFYHLNSLILRIELAQHDETYNNACDTVNFNKYLQLGYTNRISYI